MKAILTFARGWNALAAARSLGRRGVQIIAGDEYRCSPTSFSRYTIENFLYPNPDDNPDGFLDKLEEVIRKNRVAGEEYVLMPFHKETYLISANRARFEPLIKFAIPTIEQIMQVDDKGTLARLCQQRGLPIPETIVADSLEEFRGRAVGFNYPAFVKVRRSAAAVGVKRVMNSAEAIHACEEFIHRYSLGNDAIPLLQASVPGEDYCATFLFNHGALATTMTYHNIRTYPVRSGTGVLRETVSEPAMEQTGATLLASLKWHGVAEIDFRWDGQSPTPQLIEVNPRFWGGLTQSVASGWDYPWLLYRLALDGKIPPIEPGDPTIKTETPVVSLLATLTEIIQDDRQLATMRESFEQMRSEFGNGQRMQAVKDFVGRLEQGVDVKGRLELARKLFRDHGHTVSDIWAWHDPLPALGLLYPLAVFLKHGKVSTELLVS
ncbi:carboxylate--amine ligase [Lacipirellula limnantheis]|uniref:Carbamoyl phosphate synthase-like protein n=1 Tax=Lacipirellula limnantheis TaxID=2528024 RepID=A0A517TV01_9BACT|nr:ATP-grasp domain-containing protein [Lacipirellula limnantheis]QDT72194.1 carbamoyl phosphate synthase-like protein [Lacipirellula limnantheis]